MAKCVRALLLNLIFKINRKKTCPQNVKKRERCYEDLPSDKLGADFGANYFDPTSNLSLGEQLKKYLDKLGATNPEKAPNYQSLPSKEPTKSPSRTNKTTTPVYTKNNP